MVYLERLLQKWSPGKRKTLLKVLRWIAYSLRPLEVHELLVAVSTSTELDLLAANAGAINAEPCISTQEDLLSLCDGLVGRSNEGTIHFVHEAVREFVHSPAMRALDKWEESQVHEMMAVVCLRHVTCLDEAALLQPWAQAGKEIQDPKKRCHLRDYSAQYWHRHFQLAEPTSMYLPSLLHRMLQAALRKVDFESGIGDGILMVEQRIDHALQFCCRHDFLKVGKMFLEMGANIRSSGWSILHQAAASGSTKIVEYLLSNQANSHNYAELFGARGVRLAYSPIELAAFHGRTAAVEILLQVKASITYHLETDWASAYVMAVEHGRQDIVRTFLKYGSRLGQIQETESRALHLAKELEHHGIVGLISNYRSMTKSDLNQHSRPVCKTRTRAEVLHSESPQNVSVHTLEPRLRKLDLDHGSIRDAEADVSGLDDSESWSLVEYPDIDAIAAAHMDMENG